MIGSDNVEPFFGANLGLLRLAPDASIGVTAGVSTDETLYVGPSVQFSAFTVSGGVAIAEEDNDLEVDARGLLSFDISRGFSGRQDTRSLDINPTNTGGNWGVASDAISQNLALVKWNVNITELPDDSSSPYLTFKRVCDSRRFLLPLDQQSEFRVSETQIKFVPRGVYAVSYPSGYELQSGRSSLTGDVRPILGTVPRNNPVNYRQDQLYAETYNLIPSTNPNPSNYKKIPIISVSDGFVVLDRDPNDEFALDKKIVLWKDSTGTGNPDNAEAVGLVKVVSLDSNRAIGIPESGDTSNNNYFALIERPESQPDYNCRTASLDAE